MHHGMAPADGGTGAAPYAPSRPGIPSRLGLGSLPLPQTPLSEPPGSPNPPRSARPRRRAPRSAAHRGRRRAAFAGRGPAGPIATRWGAGCRDGMPEPVRRPAGSETGKPDRLRRAGREVAQRDHVRTPRRQARPPPETTGRRSVAAGRKRGSEGRPEADRPVAVDAAAIGEPAL